MVKLIESPKRMMGALLALVMFASVLSPVQLLSAQSQNEVLINVVYDGTSFDTDPLDDGSGNGVHTPGLDGGANNNVVKTYDTFAVRIDWNVNEDAATGVFLEAALPAFASWAPDATGMFAGCNPATSSFTDDQTLVCSLLDQQEGSNGTIRALATLDQPLDGTEFNVTSTLTTTDDPTGVVDELDQPLFVSEAPIANWLKGVPESSGPVTAGSEDGYVLLYPLSLIDFSQGQAPAIGSGPINSLLPIDFFDHGYKLVSSATVATAAQMTAAGFPTRSACGAYDGAGAFPVTPGTWTCGSETAPNGYPVVPINVVGHDATMAPATNADSSANSVSGGVNVLTGQIAFWLPAAGVDAEIADVSNDSGTSALFENAIAQEGASTVITGQDDVGPILVPGTAGYFDEASTVSPVGEDPANNAILSTIGISPIGGSPGATIGHNVAIHPGPLQVLESYVYGDAVTPRHNIDLRLSAQGGLQYLPGGNFWQGDSTGDFIGETPRGATLTIQSQVLTASNAPTTLFDAPIHGCTAFDNTHYSLTSFGDIPVSVTAVGTDPNTPVIVGGSSTTSNTGPLAHVYTGSARSMYNAQRGQFNAVGDEKSDLSYTVEFSNAPVPRVLGAFGVDEDQLTCDDGDDAGSSGWVDATGDLSVFDQFDADGNAGSDGLYEGITRARVRITERFPWAPGEQEFSNFTGFQAFFQVVVKADLDVQTVNQELFAAQSHSYGDLGPNGVPDLVQYLGQAPADCQPYNVLQWEANGNIDDTNTGWCNNNFVDDGANSLDTSDSVDWDNSAWQRSVLLDTGIVRYLNSSGAVVSIVEAALGLSKTNNAGLGDIKDNGQLVEFTLAPRVVGSRLEALTNVRLTDNLPANYHFVRFVTQPTTPGSSCTAPSTPDGTITCQFSEPNPAVDTGPLPPGIAGGWSDEVIIEVEVVGAVANPDSPTVITNTATTRSSGLGPWDPAIESFAGAVQTATKSVSNSANSFLPLPADEGAIVKTVDTLEGECDLHPTEDPPPGWADRCSQISFDDDMSFVLSLTNQGNTEFTNIEIVDVFPHNLDSVEPASNTPSQSGSLPNTIGDGRDPASDYEGTLGFISMDAVANAAGLVTWVSGDLSANISRDPAVTVGQAVNTWCDAVGGTVQVGPASGTCPQTPEEVTATYSLIPGALGPNDTLEIRLNLDSEGVECDDHWTNTFGARVDQILLPIRSNDVTVMVECEYDLALEKTLDPAFVPGADWLTAGSTTVDFLMEVTNQGDPIEDFEVTDYVDTSVFTFDVANNPDAATGDALALPYTWDAADPAAPVVSIDGPLASGESVLIPVTLVIEDPSGTLENWAEISYFDSDGDPTNGDSDPANAANPSTGALVDQDSVADGDTANDAQPLAAGEPGDGEIDGDGTGTDPVTGDEDDHDVAGVPLYDLSLVKTLVSADATTTPQTATFRIEVANEGNADVFAVEVTEYPPAGLTQTGVTLPVGITQTSAVTYEVAGPLAPGATISFDIDFEVSDPTATPFINAAEISGFDDDDDSANAANPFAVDVDSTPDGVNDDDVIDHDITNYDPDGDGILNEPTPGDEDDHDIAELVFPVRIGNFVWIDANADGVQDSSEAPVEGVVVNLLDADGNPVLDVDGDPITTVTDANGEYFFDVLPGDYIIEFDLDTLPENFVVTATDAGADDGADSDGDPATGQTAVISVDPSTMTDTDGDGILDDLTHDLGITPIIRIGNFVWIDANADGVQDPSESPVEGVVVNLLDADGNPVLDAAGEPITTVTDANGEYFFDVAPGEYIVEFIPPLGTQFTGQNAGDDAADSDADPTTGQTGIIDVSDPSTLTDTDGDGILDDLTHDAGIVPTAQIGNYVWLDSDNDGVQDSDEVPVAGVVVNLLDVDGTPVLGPDGEPITAVTDADGFYSFEVPAGDYMIEFDPASLPAGLQFTGQDLGGDDAADSDADPLTGLTAPFNVDPSALTDTDGDGIVDDYTYDAGVTGGVEIGDFVWFDENDDGIQDRGETPAAGVIVNLLDADGSPVLDAAGNPVTTVTNADGGYSFIVEPGDYQISFELPNGFAPTDADAGADDSVDSDAGPFGVIPTFTVEPGINDYSLDLGLIELQEISGTVWDDANSDGVQDSGETVREGVLVELLDANGGPVLDVNGDPITVLTDVNGEFLFPVPPGDYRLRFTAPDGTDLTPGTGGDHDAGEGTTGIISVTPGVDVPGIDAGLVLSATESAPILAFTGRDSLDLGLFALMTVLAGVFLTLMSRRREEELLN